MLRWRFVKCHLKIFIIINRTLVFLLFIRYSWCVSFENISKYAVILDWQMLSLLIPFIFLVDGGWREIKMERGPESNFQFSLIIIFFCFNVVSIIAHTHTLLESLLLFSLVGQILRTTLEHLVRIQFQQFSYCCCRSISFYMLSFLLIFKKKIGGSMLKRLLLAMSLACGGDSGLQLCCCSFEYTSDTHRNCARFNQCDKVGVRQRERGQVIKWPLYASTFSVCELKSIE